MPKEQPKKIDGVVVLRDVFLLFTYFQMIMCICE